MIQHPSILAVKLTSVGLRSGRHYKFMGLEAGMTHSNKGIVYAVTDGRQGAAFAEADHAAIFFAKMIWREMASQHNNDGPTSYKRKKDK